MCSCGKKKKAKSDGGTQSFTLQGGGRTQTFGSKLEAKAENVRQFAGRGKVTPN